MAKYTDAQRGLVNGGEIPLPSNAVVAGTGKTVGGATVDTSGYGTTNTHPTGYTGLSWGQMEEQGLIPKAGSTPSVATPTAPISPVTQPKSASELMDMPDIPNPDLQYSMDHPNAQNEQFMKDNPQYGYNGQPNPTVMTPEIQAATDAKINKYQKALGTINASGTPITDNAGQASGIIQQHTSAVNQDSIAPSNFTMASEIDPSVDDNFTLYDKFHSPFEQKKSLVQEYQDLSKSLGIEQINTDLLNAKNIIEGTEDDIRLEVEKTGGFATDSQVQALANSRNKSLIKNYNNLLETRNNVMTQLGTIMDLTIQDRQSAKAEFDRKMNFAFKVQDYKDKAISNAKEGLNNVIKNLGYDGFLASLGGNATTIAQTEKLLGMASGGLAQVATISANNRALEVEKANLQNDVLRSNLQTDVLQRKSIASNLLTDEMQRKNIQSQIDERNNVNGNGVLEKVITKIQSSPEYKTINAVLPSVTALKAYKDAINKYGTIEMMSGEGKGTLSGTYGNAVAAWKSLAALGALSGADFALAENIIPTTGLFRRSSTSISKLNSGIDNAIKQAENLTKRLSQNYPSASNLLSSQLDDMYVTAYPEQYTVGDDGLVYKIK